MLVEKDIVIKNKQGLHARPAAIFVQIANKYESEITVRKENEEVNGKSILGILMLAAEQGSSVCIRAEGVDAKKALEDLEQILIKQIEDITMPSKKTGNTKKRKRNI
ncbi:MAG: HPr family phosphocarrier protein [Candidatus Omnitrophota bacterium]|nr:MAG: HPr family phosphocarrier protein [Candidatus Omnitrophota bacterium]